jgi:RNA polymerase sigma factor (sigma-70 family)
MVSASTDNVLRHLQVLFRDGANGSLTDGQLIARFIDGRDESAFSILVERHGPMVLRVCRAILRDEHTAQDAFQATFLILVRRAHSVDRSRSAGPWLFGVCRRVAARARADAARRRVSERKSVAMRAKMSEQRDWHERDSWPELYEELARLPEKYRAAIVLCYLEGKTTEEAGRYLDCPRGTILSRLARARERLRKRLARRGFALPSAPIVARLSLHANLPMVPSGLAKSTVQAALRLTLVGARAGTISAAAAGMADGAIWFMGLALTRIAAALLVTVGVAAGIIVGGHQLASIEQSVRTPHRETRQKGVEDDSRSPGTALIPRVVRGQILKGHSIAAFCLAYSADGKVVASGDGDRTIKLWNATTGGERGTVRLIPRQGKHAAVMAVAFSPDSQQLAIAADDRTIRIVDAVPATGERVIVAKDYFINTLAFAPDGRTLAWAGTNPGKYPEAPGDDPWKVITLWDVAVAKERATLTGHTDGISAVAFSSDGATIVTGSYDQAVKLWDARSGRELATLRAPRPLHGIAISRDQRIIAGATGNRFAGDDGRQPAITGEVVLWDVTTRQQRALLEAHEGSARTVAFSPDSKVLASGGADGLVKLWDVATGREVAILRGHKGYVYSLAFAPDGKSVVSTGIDATVRVWKLDELL